ncbi:hypothetical protein EUV02_09580 [Polymorphobacter arshaanensis]|uniref:DUF4239 domain-containing protein n=1 Tax=Glacieibacterium arshaanense TaxID=2511025 RepID=A0A4Y9EP73_9SPHN|nr:hypothetical protein [Polymorphobacter arshaanensis]TFU03414.1 hypothetical protein EUV02_09580 [Polymorphobacter arshaanensis]
MTGFAILLENTSIVLMGSIILVLMGLAAVGANRLRQHQDRRRSRRDDTPTGVDGQEGYITSAVLGLLALLMGFTFALAVDRFEDRRELVITEANAIGTAYLRTQLLPEPHRARISGLLKAYTDQRIILASAPPARARTMLAANDQLLTDLWTATVAAFPTIKGLDFSSAYLDSINAVIDLDEERKSSRQAKVPAEVFGVLFIYIIVTAGSLGYTVSGRRGLIAAGVLLMLILMSLMMTVDIDRPTGGGIVENQLPMQRLQASMANTPPGTYDRWLEKPETE